MKKPIVVDQLVYLPKPYTDTYCFDIIIEYLTELCGVCPGKNAMLKHITARWLIEETQIKMHVEP